MALTLYHYLILAALLFSIGLYGVVTRRNVLGILMSLELMFNAANINLVAFDKYLGGDDAVYLKDGVFKEYFPRFISDEDKPDDEEQEAKRRKRSMFMKDGALVGRVIEANKDEIVLQVKVDKSGLQSLQRAIKRKDIERIKRRLDGHIFAIFIITVAAAEAVVGLALVLSIYRNLKSVYTEDMNILKW